MKLTKSKLKEIIREEILKLNEANYKLYHKTFSDAADEVLKMVKKKGYQVDEDSWFSKVTTGGTYRKARPGIGKTTRFSVKLTKHDKPLNKQVHFQVYGMEGGKYELNAYIK
jgi:hypothetical protein